MFHRPFASAWPIFYDGMFPHEIYRGPCACPLHPVHTGRAFWARMSAALLPRGALLQSAAPKGIFRGRASERSGGAQASFHDLVHPEDESRMLLHPVCTKDNQVNPHSRPAGQRVEFGHHVRNWIVACK